MERYLKISNNCTIDRAAFHLIGASTKRNDDTKIGYFGSGLKYAIATLMRNDIDFRVFSGPNEVCFTQKDVVFRGESLKVICIDDKETSLTTGLGPAWEIWMALREIVCNAMDEESASFSQCETIVPDETTSFYIPLVGHVLEFAEAWDMYFSFNRTPIHENLHGRIYPKSNAKSRIYRKGVLCYEHNDETGLYDYDFNDININESRLAECFKADCMGARIWMACDDEDLLRTFVSRIDERFSHAREARFHWDCVLNDFSPVWYSILEDRFVIPKNLSGLFVKEQGKQESLVLDNDLATSLSGKFPDLNFAGKLAGNSGQWIRCDISRENQYRINKALQFFEEVKINITAPIELVSFTRKETLGMAEDGKILLSEKLMSKGIRMIARAILEEHAHLESKYNDETREFENYLFEQMLTLLENHNGIFL
jgi:hypothetical protein